MAQPPFKADAIQIEPGTTGTRSISRDSATNGLKFIDPVFTSGLSLAQLAGIQSITGVCTVGTGGGATYTSIQDAIDAIPSTSSSLLPNVVLVFPGVYTESITLNKDGVSIIGMGDVTLTNDSAPTVTVEQSGTLIPKNVTLSNLTIVNTGGQPCVYLNGQNTYAHGTITVETTLTAGDTITIGGVTLTGVAGTRTSGSNNFNASLGTVNALAAEIQAALADTSNAFAASISSSVDGADITVRALLAGSDGNDITMASSTTPPGGITLSGANLTGGGGQDSEVGLNGIRLQNVHLQADGVSLATHTVNSVYVTGGTWAGSDIGAYAVFNQTAYVLLDQVQYLTALQFAYDSGLSSPIAGTADYIIHACPHVGGLLVNMLGLGSFGVQNSHAQDMIIGGDQFAIFENCSVGDVALADTVAVSLRNTYRGDASVEAGSPTLAESSYSGVVIFDGDTSKVVTFPVAQPDTNYSVYIDCPVLGSLPQVTSKSTTDMTIECGSAISADVAYTIIRQVV